MSRFVLDCSVALAMFFPDESNPYAKQVLDKLDVDQMVAPPILTLEFLNGLLSAERRGRIDRAATSRCTAQMAMVGVEIDDMDQIDVAQLLRLAREHGLSVYDACYLAVAIRRGLPIATLDAKLRSSATNAGVPVYQP